MQVLCKSSHEQAETHCGVCGQGFVLYWERQSAAERVETLEEIERVLRAHHAEDESAGAHPDKGFLVPEWNGPVAFSGAALLGNAPHWAL